MQRDCVGRLRCSSLVVTHARGRSGERPQVNLRIRRAMRSRPQHAQPHNKRARHPQCAQDAFAAGVRPILGTQEEIEGTSDLSWAVGACKKTRPDAAE